VTPPISTSRRDFLAATVAGSAGLLFPRMLLAEGFLDVPEFQGPGAPASVAPASMSPSEALGRLREGNARLVEGRTTGLNRGLDRIAAVAASQAPFAAILGCADSRVPPELVFDQGYGDLFVVRVAGNVATPEEMASLEFGVAALGAAFILVLGHTECGAVKAAMSPDIPPGQISTLYQHIVPGIPADTTDANVAIAGNAQHQLDVLRRGSPFLAQLLREGRVGMGSGVYDLATGRVDILNTVGV
jgi:carbonic anhydrase